MPDALKPYSDLAYDSGLVLTDAGYAYGLLIASIAPLTLAGLLIVAGLIATHGKSHGTRFSAMALFVFAGVAAGGAWLLRPDAASGTLLGALLAWAWLPPLIAGLSVLLTMPEKAKPRAAGLGLATLLALGATLFGGMLSVANERALNPGETAWLDAEPVVEQPAVEQEAVPARETLSVVNTAD